MTDTVYLQQEPLIIRKQVIVEVPAARYAALENCFLTLGYAYGRYILSQQQGSYQESLAPIHLPMVKVGRSFHERWSLSVGLGRSFSELSYAYSESFDRIVETQMQRYDTTGQYTIKDPTGDITVYSIDTIEYIDRQVQPYDSTLQTKQRLSFWTIPIQLAYKIVYKKIYAQPVLGLQMHIASGANHGKPEKGLTIPKNYLSAVLGLEVGTSIYKNINLEVGLMTTRQLTDRHGYLSMDQVLANAQLKFSF